MASLDDEQLACFALPCLAGWLACWTQSIFCGLDKIGFPGNAFRDATERYWGCSGTPANI